MSSSLSSLSCTESTTNGGFSWHTNEGFWDHSESSSNESDGNLTLEIASNTSDTKVTTHSTSSDSNSSGTITEISKSTETELSRG
ncbi:MAG: hypothetical protein CMA59_00795 [Euryarchaeota archaeon]|nr:hypothetical protein [Euryarchaeota archaeon]